LKEILPIGTRCSHGAVRRPVTCDSEEADAPHRGVATTSMRWPLFDLLSGFTNVVATGSPQDESVRRADLWPVDAWNSSFYCTAHRAVATGFHVKQDFGRRPPRLDRLFDTSPLYFVTFCTHLRKPYLARDEVHAGFVAYSERAQRDFNIAVGRYVIMPDHVHPFCASTSWTMIRRRFPALRMLPSRSVSTPRRFPISRASTFVPRKAKHDVRAGTRSPATLVSALRISSATPS